MAVHEKELMLPDYDCDFRNQIKCSAILRHAQQIGREHHQLLGITYELHEKTKTAFLVAENNIHIAEPIFGGEMITVRTEGFAPQYAAFLRKTQFLRGGRVCVEVETEWVLVDSEEHRLLRKYPPELSALFPPEQRPEGRARLRRTEARPHSMTAVRYSMTDPYGHLNNAAYADLICDFLPSDRPIRQMQIRYQAEAKLREVLQLFVGHEEELWYLCGKMQNGSYCFESNVIFC